jgi:type IV pilus assembly protein PilQ
MRNLPYACKAKVLVSVLLLVIALYLCLLPAAAAEDANKAEVLTPIQRKMQQPVSVDFRETPIDDVLRMLAKQADVDIVKSPAVIGNVTATLTDVPLAEALNNILAAHGYGYLATENMIRVVPQKDIYDAPEKILERVYKITYADVKELEKALTKFISKRGSISSMPGTSNIIVKDIESNIQAMDKFVEQVDRVTPQVLIEVRIYDITHTDRLDLGVEWWASRNTTYAATIGGVHTGETTPHIGAGFGTTLEATENTGGLFEYGILNSSVNIDVLLTAKQEDITAKLLANPRILVLDNEDALFDIVTEVPYTERETTGSTVLQNVKFKEIGVLLRVNPHVARDGMIRLRIEPEFSVQIATTADVPTVDTRKMKTIALIKDGETAVLGGLRKKNVTREADKVPLLGDMPLLGGLFKFHGENTAINELVIFITPRIVERPIMTDKEHKAYGLTEFPLPEVTNTKAEDALEE